MTMRLKSPRECRWWWFLALVTAICSVTQRCCVEARDWVTSQGPAGRPVWQCASCVVPEQCSCSERSERAERSERSEHVWPQIVRNIWPTLARIHPKWVKICSKHPKSTCGDLGMSVLILVSHLASDAATGYVAKISGTFGQH